MAFALLDHNSMPAYHQTFIVARIPGQGYRALSTLPLEWVDGATVVGICRRLVRLFSNPKHKLGLQQELIFAEYFFENRLGQTSQTSKSNDECPFPFLSTILLVGAAAQTECGYCYRVAFNPFSRMANPKNDVVMAVIDITDLEAVRYGILNLDRNVDTTNPPCTILSVWEYLAGRANVENFKQRHGAGRARRVRRIDELDAYAVITPGALFSIWPDGDWLGPPETIVEREVRHGAPSLFSSCVKKLVEGASDPSSGEFDTAILVVPMQFESFRAALHRYLPSMASGTNMRNLLGALLQVEMSLAGERHHVDLSRYTKLSINDIKLLLCRLGISTSVSAISLPIGIMSSASGKDIADAIPPGGISEFYIHGGSSGASADFTALWTSGRVTTRLVMNGIYAAGLCQRPWLSRVNPPSPPPGQVLQLILCEPGPGNKDCKRALAALCLGEALLTPMRFITGFYTYLRFLTREPRNEVNDLVMTQFAFAAGDGGEVGPLPAELSYIATNTLQSGTMKLKFHADAVRNMTRGSWTVLCVQSQIPDIGGSTTLSFQVGFVRPRRLIAGRRLEEYDEIRRRDFEVFDMKGYLECVQPDSSEALQSIHQSFVDYLQVYGAKRPVVVEGLGEEDALEVLRNATAYETPPSMVWMTGRPSWRDSLPMMDQYDWRVNQ